MKKVLFSLAVFLSVAACPHVAQAQFGPIHNRHSYTYNYSKWYHSLSLGMTAGPVSKCSYSGEYTGNLHIRIEDRMKDQSQISKSITFLQFSYEALFRKNNLYLGPGSSFRIDFENASCFDLYLRGRYGLGPDNWLIMPFVEGAIGGMYYKNMNGTNYSVKIRRFSDNSGHADVGFSYNHLLPKSGIKPYLDFGVGALLKFTKKGGGLSYGLRLSSQPTVAAEFDWNENTSKIDAVPRNSEVFLPMKLQYSYKLHFSFVSSIIF